MDWNFATAFEAVADALPNRQALRQGTRIRTWAEFDERSARLAAALGAAGLGPDSKVASYCYNSNEYVEGLFGTLKARAVPVNVNYRYLEDELVYLLENSDAEALLFGASLRDHVAAVMPRVPGVRLWVQIDDDHGAAVIDGAVGYEELLASNEPAPRIERSGDDLILLYTGGTTGMPKGVMWRNEDLFGVLAESLYPLFGHAMPDTNAQVGTTAVAIADTRDAVHLPASPLMHGTGMFTSFQSLMAGGSIVTLEGHSFDPHELWRTVAEAGVTQMAIVGDAFAKPMLAALRDAEAAGTPHDVSSVGLVISSGVIWSAEVKREFAERVQCFCLDSLGSSEAVGMASAMTGPGIEQETAKFKVGAKAKVFTEDGREVEPGSTETGLVAVGGFIPAGYYKDEQKSAGTFKVFQGRRWSIPGDFATVEADGSITLLGRGSNCINTGGEKVFPEEVEEAVKLHDSVADCLVVGLPDDRFGQAIAAVVVLEDGVEAGEATTSAIAASLGALSRYKHPRRWVFTDATLRAANGKADYKTAKAIAEAG